MNTDVMPAVRNWLADAANASPLARAQLIDDVIHEVYSYVKRTQVTGLGLDGHDGGERMALAPLADAAADYLHQMRMQSLG